MRRKIVIGISLLVIGILYLKVISPKFNIHIPCVFNKITGYECPGCGMTRAALAILDGNIYQAFRWNMLVFILTPLFGIYTLLEKKNLLQQSKVVMVCMLILTGIFFVLRNTEAFHWMAPTYIG